MLAPAVRGGGGRGLPFFAASVAAAFAGQQACAGEKVIVGLPTSETLRGNSSSSGRFHEGLLH